MMRGDARKRAEEEKQKAYSALLGPALDADTLRKWRKDAAPTGSRGASRMATETVTMYRVVCDECKASAQDGGEYSAWREPEHAREEAMDAGWTVREGLVLCEPCACRTVCMGGDDDCTRRDVAEADDGWMYCPEHRREGMDDG